MLMTCCRTDQSALDASASHRFEVNALIGENIEELGTIGAPKWRSLSWEDSVPFN